MTVKELFDFIKGVRPGFAFTDAQLTVWLNEIEGHVQTDIWLLEPAVDETQTGLVEYDSTIDPETGEMVDANHELLVPFPWNKLYRYFLLMSIDLANGEYQRYANSYELFNEAYEEYAGWYAQHVSPANGDAITRGYYISAYQFAARGRYTGTEEEFYEELAHVGEAVESGARAEAAADAAEGFADEAHAWANGGEAGVPSETNNAKHYADMARAHYGAPRTAVSGADMMDGSLIYVYVGTTTADYTNGHWYYHDGTGWEDGGVYNSTAFETDTTLSYEGLAADAKAAGDRITRIQTYEQKKDYMFDGLPFYEIKAPFITQRYGYYKENNQWILSSTKRNATDIIKCPKYLMIYPKIPNVGMFIYIGDVVGGEFVVDETAEFFVTSSGVINQISSLSGFMTYETDGTKYMWIGAATNSAAKDGYEDYFSIIGADEWPESPFPPNAWTYHSGSNSNNCVKTSTAAAGYYLPEESWVFVRGVEMSLINYGVGSTAGKPWSNYAKNVSAIYIPKNSGMPMLTVNQSDVVNKSNVCIVPKIIDRCLTSNAAKAEHFASTVINNFRYIGKSDNVNIATNLPITVGKEYHTIPYSGLWQPQHFVCFDTTPETAANAANDEYSVFYDDTEARSELSADGAKRPGYGGVCSIFASLASGSPYPQSTDGFYSDSNFEILMFDNPRSGDICQYKSESGSEHVALVGTVLDNGYAMYEYAPPGIIQTIHTSKITVPLDNGKVSIDYLKNYNHKISSKDRTGWETNYLDFDYEIANGSIRPWRGNKSVCSDFNKMTVPASSLSRHTGIHITVHDGAHTAYIKKPSGTIVELNVSGQTVVTINAIVDEPGQYELYSDVSNIKEYFRYFEHDPVTVHFEADGTCVFSSDDIDYAYVWCYGISTDYPENPTAAPTVIAKGKRYPGVSIRGIKAAVARDTTMVNGIEDSWGRYPVVCTASV